MWNWWVFFFRFSNIFFCFYRVIYLTDLSAGFVTTKKSKSSQFSLFFIFKEMIILLKNNLAGSLNLVKLAWTCRSHYLFENNCFVFYIQLGQISVNRFFKWLFYLFWVKILCSVPKHYLYDCYISTLFILQVFDFCSIVWFRFQKPLAIGPFLIQRYQDFWDKSLGGSLDFNLRGLGGSGDSPRITEIIFEV